MKYYSLCLSLKLFYKTCLYFSRDTLLPIILIRVGNYVQFLHNVIETKSFGNVNDKPEHFMVADK